MPIDTPISLSNQASIVQKAGRQFVGFQPGIRHDHKKQAEPAITSPVPPVRAFIFRAASAETGATFRPRPSEHAIFKLADKRQCAGMRRWDQKS